MNLKAIERYASSVFAELILISENEVVKFVAETGRFLELTNQSKELNEFFTSPAFSEGEKIEVFSLIAGMMDFSDHFRTLYIILIEHRRTSSLADIKTAIEKYHDHHSGIEEAVLSTPFEFTKDELETIKEKLSGLTENKKIRLIQKIDPELLGGAVIRIQDKVYDASLRLMMKNLKKNIMEIG